MKKNGAFYVVSPWALTWDDENYYLVAYDAAAGIIKHYRVDKMRDTEILEADRKGEESFKKLVSVSSQFFWLAYRCRIRDENCRIGRRKAAV